jgi:Fur family zinc uptake transcriptional regulator
MLKTALPIVDARMVSTQPHSPHHHAHGEACGHGHPPREVMAVAEKRCAERHLRLTPIRRETLSHLASSTRPLGAYELIELMGVAGKRPAPITVYRALEFLLGAGLIHRIESRNAYMACAHAHEGDDPVVFMICDACGCVTEASSDALSRNLEGLARNAGFRPTSRVVELFGACSHCV